MLAELFMLRLEAIARPSRDSIPSFERFVPLNVPTEFKNKSLNRRS
jgi:hypothetical protein